MYLKQTKKDSGLNFSSFIGLCYEVTDRHFLLSKGFLCIIKNVCVWNTKYVNTLFFA